MSTADAGALPWRDGDLVMLLGTTIGGLAAIAGAWFGVSGAVSVTQQAAWLNLAVAGFAVFAVGNCLWLLRLRRTVGERRIALVSLDIGLDDADAAATAPARPGTSTLRLVRVEGMTRVHYADCPLVAGKSVAPATVADGEPCGMCGR